MNLSVRLLDLLLVCVSQWPPTVAMQNGLELHSYAFSWLAGLLTEEWEPRCSGTVVTVHFVLTSASCLIYISFNGSHNIIDPHEFIVVVPSRSITVRNVDSVILHPDVTVEFVYTVGLIGVKVPFQTDGPHVSIMAVWPRKEEQDEEINYVLDFMGFMSCSVVTWNNNDRKHRKGDRRDVIPSNYPSRHFVSFAEVTVVHPLTCLTEVCGNSTECLEKLNLTVCVRAVEPKNAVFCDADRGAGLICQDFLWGVFIGGASCSNKRVKYPLFARIDQAVDFIADSYSKYPHTAFSTAPTLRLADVLFGIKYMHFWLQHYSVTNMSRLSTGSTQIPYWHRHLCKPRQPSINKKMGVVLN